jgi:diguanylate cyclase (GGDEF)-like protein
MFIILDIDFFKLYNDTYGHQAGDFAIKTVAKNLKSSLKRAGDMAFRLGGEEFGILCIGMNSSEALSFANSIREKVESEKIEHIKNSASKYLTISMGLVIIEPDFINNVSDLYKHADEALYKAKESGRNQVVVYDS